MTGRGGPSSSTTSAPGSGGEVPRTRDCPSDSLRSLSNRGNHLSVRVSDPLMRGYRFLWELYPNGHDLSLGRRGRRAPVLLRALRPFWTDLRLLEDNAGSGRLSSGYQDVQAPSPPPPPSGPGQVVVNIPAQSPPKVMMPCRNCGNLNDITLGRCPRCGAPFA